MNIIASYKFEENLNQIFNYIAKDSLDRAVNFYKGLYQQIDNIPFMPYRHRKNQTSNDKNIRDLIFKGYIVVFRIDDEIIEILNIYKQNLPK